MVLAGIGSVTLIDDRPVGQSEPGNFLVHFNADPALRYPHYDFDFSHSSFANHLSCNGPVEPYSLIQVHPPGRMAGDGSQVESMLWGM